MQAQLKVRSRRVPTLPKKATPGKKKAAHQKQDMQFLEQLMKQDRTFYSKLIQEELQVQEQQLNKQIETIGGHHNQGDRAGNGQKMPSQKAWKKAEQHHVIRVYHRDKNAISEM